MCPSCSPSLPASLPRSITTALAGLALSFAVLITYRPVFSAHFLLWDDVSFILHNHRIHSLSLDSLADIFRVRPRLGPHPFALYTPLAELSAALEFQLAGASPRLYHSTNLILHLLNVFLLRRILRALGISSAAAWLGATAFALHPLQVESVAWISQRKNLLCAFFSFLAVLAHIRSRTAQSRPAYLLSALFCICALLAKPAAITLPLVFIAYDAFARRLSWYAAFPRQLPLIFAAALISLVSIHLQSEAGALTVAFPHVGLSDFATACRGLFFYLAKFLLPCQLAPVYLRQTLSTPVAVLWSLAPLFLAAVIVFTRKLAPLVSLGVLWYVILLLPALQLFPTGLQLLAADRFFYLPSLGIFLASSSLINLGLSRTPRLTSGVALLILSFWSWRTNAYARVWRDDLSLWSHLRRVQPNLTLANKNYAIALYYAGNTDAALPLLRSIACQQHDFRVLTLLAEAELSAGNPSNALHWANAAVCAAPRAPAPRFTRALIFSSLGHYAAATSDWSALLTLHPLHPAAHAFLAHDLLALGCTNDALQALHTHFNLPSKLPFTLHHQKP